MRRKMQMPTADSQPQRLHIDRPVAQLSRDVGRARGEPPCLGTLALAWTWKKERDDYGSAHWQTKAELKKNDMLQVPGKGFVCGKLARRPRRPSSSPRPPSRM